MDNLYNDPASESKRKELESVLIKLARDTGDPILPRLEASVQNKKL